MATTFKTSQKCRTFLPNRFVSIHRMIVVYKWSDDYKAALSPVILPGKVMFPAVTGLAYPEYSGEYPVLTTS